jgi:hypothetical protein
MKSKDDILLERAYSKVLKESYDEDDHMRDDDSNIFHRKDEIIFNDPHNLPYSYAVSYEKKMESGFTDDSVLGVEINWAKAFKKDSEDVEFVFDVTNETNPSLSDIEDWVYNYEIGDTKLDIL